MYKKKQTKERMKVFKKHTNTHTHQITHVRFSNQRLTSHKYKPHLTHMNDGDA